MRVAVTAPRHARSAPRGLANRRAATQPYREAVVGVLECDIDVELVDEPQPKSWLRRVAGGGNKACQGIDWTAPLVMNDDHDAVRCGPEAHSHRSAPVDQGVADCHGDADQQVFQDRVGDAAAADLRERLPGLDSGPVDLLNNGPGLFEWIGGEGERFEYRGILEAVVRTMDA